MNQPAVTHIPVLLQASVEALAIRPQGIYVDGTFGRGGHSAAILQKLSKEGRLIAFDKDPDAIAAGKAQFDEDHRVTLIQGSFAKMKQALNELGFLGRVNGILLDLGVSTPQLREPQRGFSFQQSGPLDMRMDPTQGESAKEWIARVDETTLANTLYQFGEERYSRRIARAIVERRHVTPIETTGDLATLVEKAIPRREKSKHPATRTFQAIRIVVNHELDDLKIGLGDVLDILSDMGRLVVISFHSLEDRLVKKTLGEFANPSTGLPKDLPIMPQEQKPLMKIVGKALKPSPEEINNNPLARSAVMRIAEKIG